jgi:hypothetical protein
MLRIQSGSGQTLQLEKDISVELELNSWLLSDSEDLPGSFSYPISFPLSDQNKRFLNHSHLPEARPVEQKVFVWLNGIMLRQATLSYKKDKGGASGFLKVDAGEMASKIKGKYLHEVFTEKYNFGSSVANLKLLMKATASAAPGVYPFTFFPVFNNMFSPPVADMKDFPNYQRYDLINAWDGTNFQVENNRHIVPFLYLTYVIEKVCEEFGFKATGSFMQHPEIQRLTIYNTQTMSVFALNADPGIKQNLGMHVPYITIGEFLKALRDDFGVGIFFDTTKMECSFELFDSIRDNARAFKDLSPYLLKGYDNEDPDERGYSLISYQDDEDGYYKSYKPVNYKIREGQKEIKASIGTLQMMNASQIGDNADQPYIPVASQKGNLAAGIFRESSDYFNLVPRHNNSFGFRLLSYRGMQPDSDGNLYPFGSSVTRNNNQEKVGMWSLDAKQQDSVFNKLTVPYYNFLAYARRIRYNLLMPVGQSKNLRLQDLYGIRGENSVLVKFLINKLSLNLPGKSGTIMAKASVLLLLSPDANPNVFNGEQFYVEMYTTSEYSSIEGDREISYVDFMIKVWADSAKTVPANPTNLTVQYQEYISVSAPGQSNTNTTNFYSISMSGHEYALTGLISSDQSPAEQITVVYGLTTSADYIIVG